jgi:hypothetical protein
MAVASLRKTITLAAGKQSPIWSGTLHFLPNLPTRTLGWGTKPLAALFPVRYKHLLFARPAA